MVLFFLEAASNRMTTNSRVIRLIRRARDGDGEALGELLQRYRPYLKILARRYLDSRVEVRLDASDLVQQTCLSVFGRIQGFVGDNEQEFIAWVRAIHENNIRNAIRDHSLVARRSVGRETSSGNERLASHADPADEASPSQRLLASERAVRLAAAMQDLPEDQSEAVRLRYLEGWPLARIAEHMQRSFDSVAGLVKRGLIGLRKRLKEMGQDDDE
jgi:RNA polymerase sigma-70 factor (ECF subfamily)